MSGGHSSRNNSQDLELQQELAKQRQQQQEELEEAKKKRMSLLRRQLGGAGSLIPSGDNGQSTLGG